MTYFKYYIKKTNKQTNKKVVFYHSADAYPPSWANLHFL